MGTPSKLSASQAAEWKPGHAALPRHPGKGPWRLWTMVHESNTLPLALKMCSYVRCDAFHTVTRP